MNPVRMSLMIVAIICFVLAAVEIKPAKGNLMAVGLALWALSVLIT